MHTLEMLFGFHGEIHVALDLSRTILSFVVEVERQLDNSEVMARLVRFVPQRVVRQPAIYVPISPIQLGQHNIATWAVYLGCLKEAEEEIGELKDVDKKDIDCSGLAASGIHAWSRVVDLIAECKKFSAEAEASIREEIDMSIRNFTFFG
jgi:hypothetical protein